MSSLNLSWTTSTSQTSPGTITGLTNGREYDVQVGAVFTATTKWSESVRGALIGPPSDEAVVPADSSLKVSWTHGAGADSHTVRYRTKSPQTGRSSPFTISGLSNNTAYDVQVGAVYGTETKWGAIISGTPVPQPPPSNVAVAAGDGALTVSWTAATGADSHSVQHRRKGTMNWTTLESQSSPVTICSLANGTEYDVQVGAVYGATTKWSATVTGTPEANGPPSFTDSAPANFAENGTGTVHTATATDPDGDTITFALKSGKDSALFSLTSAGVLTFKTAPNYEDPKDANTDNDYLLDIVASSGTGGRLLTAEKTYTITVTDVNTEAPGKPAAPTLTAGDKQIEVSWTAPSNAGPAITAYKVRYKTGSDSWSEATPNPATATLLTLTNLTNDNEYEVQVQATNDEDTGDWSDSATATPNDDGAGLVFADAPVAVDENGGAATYTVKLASQPSGTVTVSVTSADTNAATVSPASLEFTATDWSTAQTVTVAGVNDDIDNIGDKRNVNINHTASGGGYSVTGAVAVTLTDDDTRGITRSYASLSLPESSAETYTVVLDTEPTDAVTVTVTSDDATAAEVSADATTYAATATLTFTTATWDATQTVTVRGVNDDLDNPGDQRQATLSHAAASDDDRYDGLTGSSITVTVTVTDDDIVAPANLAATAGNRSATLTWDLPDSPQIAKYQTRRLEGRGHGPDELGRRGQQRRRDRGARHHPERELHGLDGGVARLHDGGRTRIKRHGATGAGGRRPSRHYQ